MLNPLNNHCLVAVPERYLAPQGPRSPEGLAISLLSGEDAMHELEAQIKRGGKLQIETDTDRSIRNLVRVGQVLQIPPALNDQMYLCAAGEQYRTYADITPVVEVGDTVYLDFSCLTDENEILPGIYRVPYAAVICVIRQEVPESGCIEFELNGKKRYTMVSDLQLARHHFKHDVPAFPKKLVPVGGYVLLSRVWAADVQEYEIDGRMRKVRFGKDGYLVEQVDVPPLDNEGEVAFVDAPLKGALNELHPGQRVLITKGQALVETICGTEYLVVRHDYCMAVLEPNFAAVSADFTEEDAAKYFAAPFSPEAIARATDGKFHVLTHPTCLAIAKLNQNPFTKEFQRLPLDHPSYLA